MTWKQPLINGSEIRRSPVDMEVSPIIYKVSTVCQVVFSLDFSINSISNPNKMHVIQKGNEFPLQNYHHICIQKLDSQQNGWHWMTPKKEIQAAKKTAANKVLFLFHDLLKLASPTSNEADLKGPKITRATLDLFGFPQWPKETTDLADHCVM